MKERRFARTISLPSTLQLKHLILRDRFEEAEKQARLDNVPGQGSCPSVESRAP
jgi:hypothetical protein